MKGKPLEMGLLYDFYGEILTSKQRKVFELYYNEDFSLSEIAEQAGITRQGVRDCVKRAEQILLAMEQKLGLVRQFRQTAAISPDRLSYSVSDPIPNSRSDHLYSIPDSASNTPETDIAAEITQKIMQEITQELRALAVLNTTTLHNGELAAHIMRLSQLFQELQSGGANEWRLKDLPKKYHPRSKACEAKDD